MTTVAIAGSRALPAGLPGRLLVRFLAALPDDATVLLRRGISTPPGTFEKQVADLVKLLGLTVEWREPELEGWRENLREVALSNPGRRATFARDVKMVTDADVTLCFWSEDQTGNETSGTVSLADKATMYNRPIYAYAVTADGRVEEVGSWDPMGEWEGRVPSPA